MRENQGLGWKNYRPMVVEGKVNQISEIHFDNRTPSKVIRHFTACPSQQLTAFPISFLAVGLCEVLSLAQQVRPSVGRKASPYLGALLPVQTVLVLAAVIPGTNQAVHPKLS